MHRHLEQVTLECSVQEPVGLVIPRRIAEHACVTRSNTRAFHLALPHRLRPPAKRILENIRATNSATNTRTPREYCPSSIWRNKSSQRIKHQPAEQLGIEVGALGWHPLSMFRNGTNMPKRGRHHHGGQLKSTSLRLLASEIASY